MSHLFAGILVIYAGCFCFLNELQLAKIGLARSGPYFKELNTRDLDELSSDLAEMVAAFTNPLIELIENKFIRFVDGLDKPVSTP